MVKSSQVSPRTLARLKRSLQTAGVTQKSIAERAAVTDTMVSHVLAGRTISAPVLRVAKALLAEAKVERTNGLLDAAGAR